MIVYTSPSVPPLEGKGWLRTENVLPIFNGLLNAPADKRSSRVPRYQNPLKVVGFCDFQVKPLPWRGQRGLGLRLKSLLMKKGLGLMEDGREIPALKPSLIKGL